MATCDVREGISRWGDLRNEKWLVNGFENNCKSKKVLGKFCLRTAIFRIMVFLT